MSDTTNSEKNKDSVPDTGHEYDGIRELDNQLPTWWLLSFYLTILFSIPYVFYYHVFNGPTLNETFEREQKAIWYAQASKGTPGPAFEEAQLLTAVKDPVHQSKGKQVYTTKCASCHGTQGQGGIGPNLTDDYWLHGGRPIEVATTIDVGVLDKGMPSWRAMMSAEEIISVVAFVNTIQGTKPPGAKGPQGVRYEINSKHIHRETGHH
jgi:cytochrome c oxidase cbb3-type subunit III